MIAVYPQQPQVNCLFNLELCLKPFHLLDTEASALELFANGSNDADNRDREPSKAEDPLVSLVTQSGLCPKEDLIKMFPDIYPTTASEGFK